MKRSRPLALVFASAGLWILFFLGSVFAQERGAEIFNIDPPSVTQGLQETVTVVGARFTSPVSAFLTQDGEQILLLEADFQSNNVIEVSWTWELDPGDYDFCLQFDGTPEADAPCEPFKIRLPRIISVAPATIFSAKEAPRQIVFEVADVTEPLTPTVGGHVLEFDPPLVKRDENSEYLVALTATLPLSVLPGSYYPAITLADGQEIPSPDQLQVKGAISPTLESVEPERILRYPQEAVVITVTGTNLADVSRIMLGGQECELAVVSDSKLECSDSGSSSIYYYYAPYQYRRLGSLDLELSFPDGSTLTSNVRVIERVLPVRNWIPSFITLILLTLGSIGFAYFQSAKRHQEHLLNKTAPGVWEVLSLVITGLGAGIILTLVSAIIWSFDFGLEYAGIGYLWVTVMLGINIAVPLIFARLNGKFVEIVPAPARYAIALALITLAIVLPFVFTQLQATQWAVWVELAILAVSSLLGMLGLRAARRQLQEERDRPKDEQIDARVQQILHHLGAVNAETDLSEFPRDRADAALARYYAQHAGREGLVYSELESRLTYNRWEAVRDLSAAFEALRLGLLAGDATQGPSVDDLALALGDELRSQFSFAAGEGYKLRDVPNEFRVLSTVPSGLESVLPDPFPLILFLSRLAITPEQIGQLQAILNQLDVPSRFALFVPINDVVVTGDRIRQNLGGIGRENVAVLGEPECRGVLASIDVVRLAFMQAIQQQVDLTIFSPYRTQGPTTEDMFYGRKKELGTILETINEGSIAVLGARRIGKTSMLQAAQRVLGERGKVLLYLDCYHIRDYETFFSEIATRWDVPELDMASYTRINDFPRFVNDLQRLYPERQIVFQFDEVDRLLAFDMERKRDEILFRMFRSLAQEKRCQFLFSGERTILDQLANPSSCFFNFPTPISLGLLDRDTCDSLVLEPMELVGAGLEDREAILSMVFDQTGGHPNLVQSLCRRCLEALSRSQTRVVSLELVERVSNEADFRERYLATYWSQANPLEKAMSVCVAMHNAASEGEVLGCLRAEGIKIRVSQLKRGLRYLTLSQLLISTNGRYEIQPSRFQECLEPLSHAQWLEDFEEEWKEYQGAESDG